MDKKREKELVSNTEKLLEDLISKNILSNEELPKMMKLIQKVASGNSKKKEEDEKNLNDFISTKNEIQKFLEQDKNNLTILMKATQKIISKSQPPKLSAKSGDKQESGVNNKSKNEFIFEKFKMEENIDQDSIYIFMENLTGGENYFDCNNDLIPVYTWIYYPKEKMINIYIKQKDNLKMHFSQVNYLTNEAKETFLNLDYWSMIVQNNDLKEKEYKENIFDMEKLEKELKEAQIMKKNKTEISFLNNDYNILKNNIKTLCESYKEKIKSIKINEKDFLRGLLK